MDIDSVVVGGGVVGLACARLLAQSGRDVIVLEQNSAIGEETSSRNSEVIHAGIYYPKESLKAKLCVRGRELLYKYCESHAIEHQRLGKLIVATNIEQLGKLNAIFDKGRANGVEDLRFVEQEELRVAEPRLNAIRAILSPSTGIIDSHQLMLAMQGDIESNGGWICLHSPMLSATVIDGGFRVSVGGDEPTEITCRELINSGGLHAQLCANNIKGMSKGSIPPRHLSRGCYFTLSGRSPFNRLIYPIPNNEGLGVHLTLDLQGYARFGPDTQWVDTINYDVDPRRADSFYEAIRDYYPDLIDDSLSPAYAGIRPKVTGPDELAGDFIIQGEQQHLIKGYVGLYGIESPGLTSSLAIAEMVLNLL